MKKILLILILLCSVSFSQDLVRRKLSIPSSSGAPIALDSAAGWTQMPYTSNTGQSVTVTPTGARLTGVLFIEYDTANPPTSVVICGVSVASPFNTPVVTHLDASLTYAAYLAKGFSGSCTTSYSAVGQTLGALYILQNTNQTSQPDAIGAYAFGNTAGTGEAPVTVTVVAPGSMVLGLYGVTTFANTPSSNGTWDGQGSFGVFNTWHSTVPVASAGSFSLQAQTTSSTVDYESFGVSIAP